MAAVLAAACAPPAEAPADPDALPLKGTVPFAPLEKVDFVLTDTHGDAYDFRRETDGRIALLFFGYTYCPDICPIHMATLAAALRQLPEAVRSRITTVFVTVDPARDTPERLQGWLAAFDSTFVGLSGSDGDIAEALAFYGYHAPETSGEEVGYTVGHPALIYAFAPDNLGRAMYGPETPQAVWVHDLTLLAGHDWSGSEGTATAPADTPPAAEAGGIQVLDPVVPRPPTATTTAFYFTLRNTGTVADTLLGLSADVAERATLHDMVLSGNVMRMAPLAMFVYPEMKFSTPCTSGSNDCRSTVPRSLQSTCSDTEGSSDTVTTWWMSSSGCLSHVNSPRRIGSAESSSSSA